MAQAAPIQHHDDIQGLGQEPAAPAIMAINEAQQQLLPDDQQAEIQQQPINAADGIALIQVAKIVLLIISVPILLNILAGLF